MNSDANSPEPEERQTSTEASEAFDWKVIRGRFEQLRQDTVQGDDLSSEETARLLQQRAEVLAESAEAVDHEGVIELMVLNLSDEKLGLETRFIHEVMRVSDITPIPGAPNLLTGVTNLRGSVLPVMNIRMAFEIGGEAPGDETLIVVGGEQPEFGVLVDGVFDMISLNADELLPAPANLAGVQADLCRAVTDGAMMVLDGDALITHDYFYIGDDAENTDRGGAP